MMLCPCQSQSVYAQCCQPFHQGRLPASAEQLMRSRYSAYTYRLIDYIVQTTLPCQQPLLDAAELLAWSASVEWQGLQIVSAQLAAHSNQHAWVHFLAQFRSAQGSGVHDEQSAFVRVKDRWYFIDPTVSQAVERNARCLCGSSLKFKKCCGPMWRIG